MSEVKEALGKADSIGCVGGMLHFFLALPAWLFMLHHLLSSVDTPAKIWAAYWVYVPTCVIAAVLSQALKSQELKALRAANEKAGR